MERTSKAMGPALRGLLRGAAVGAAASCLAACGDSAPMSASASASGETMTSTTGAMTGTETGTTTETGTGGATEGGTGWSSSLEVGTEHGAFLSVWGPSPTEVYAVGGQLVSGGSHGMIFRWDGEAWGEEVLPDDTPSLNWVTGAGDDVWAVGYGGAALRLEGGSWVRYPSPTESMLWGAWGVGEGEVWAVGGDGVKDEPVLLRWGGEAWESVVLPALDEASHGLFKVWGSAADDVMIVGDRGVTLRYDGAQWSAVDTGSIVDLISLWGPGDGTLLSVGGRANGRLARWDGATWSGETLSIPGLNGVWVDSGGTATLVGWQGTIYSLAAGSLAPVPEESGTSLLLHAVYGFEGGPRFAVGGTLQTAPPFVGLVLVDDG